MSEEFSAGVKILLQRMETHPEEFYEPQYKVDSIRTPKWHNVMTSVLQIKFKESARGDALFFTEAEVDALYAGYSNIRRKTFDDYVMGSVLNPEQELSSNDPHAKMQAQYGQQKLRVSGASNNVNDAQQYSGYSNLQGMYDADTNQYHNTSQSQAEHIAAHQRALSAAAMNAYPYASSQDPHPQPMTESMLSRINKRLGFK
jgi:hypothetical protein